VSSRYIKPAEKRPLLAKIHSNLRERSNAQEVMNNMLGIIFPSMPLVRCTKSFSKVSSVFAVTPPNMSTRSNAGKPF
jgi:hypothetical protein